MRGQAQAAVRWVGIVGLCSGFELLSCAVGLNCLQWGTSIFCLEDWYVTRSPHVGASTTQWRGRHEGAGHGVSWGGRGGWRSVVMAEGDGEPLCAHSDLKCLSPNWTGFSSA